MQIAHDGHAPMQKMGQNARVQISNMNENVQNVGHWIQTCMSMVMKGPGSLSAALPCFRVHAKLKKTSGFQKAYVHGKGF